MSQPLDSESYEPEDQTEADRTAKFLASVPNGQDVYWERFNIIAQQNPYYGPWLPLVVEPLTQEEYRAALLEANRLTKLAHGQIGSNTPADQSDVKQAHSPREE